MYFGEIYIISVHSAMVYTIKYAILRYIRLTLSAITDTIQEQPVNFSIHFIWGREVVLWCICIIVKVVKEYICSTATNKLVQNDPWKSVSWRSLTWIMWPWIRKHDSSSAIAAQMTSNYKHWALHIVCISTANGIKNFIGSNAKISNVRICMPDKIFYILSGTYFVPLFENPK